MSDDRALEVVFMLDCTGSMSGWINSLKEDIKSIVDAIVSKKQRTVKVALIQFRDHCDDWVVKVDDLTTDINKIYLVLEQAKADGGGDQPEAMADAMDACLNSISWTDDTQKIAMMLTDSFPHGINLFTNITEGDSELCTCGLDIIVLAKEMARRSITLFTIVSYDTSLTFWAGLAHITGGRLFESDFAANPDLKNAVVDCILEDTSIEELMTRIHNEVNEEAMRTGGEVDEVELTRRLQAAIDSRGATIVTHRGDSRIPQEHIEAFLRFNDTKECNVFLYRLHTEPQNAEVRRERRGRVRERVGERRDRPTTRSRGRLRKYFPKERSPLRKSLRLEFKKGAVESSSSSEEAVESSSSSEEAVKSNSSNEKSDEKDQDHEERTDSVEMDPALRRAVRKAVLRKDSKKK